MDRKRKDNLELSIISNAPLRPRFWEKSLISKSTRMCFFEHFFWAIIKFKLIWTKVNSRSV